MKEFDNYIYDKTKRFLASLVDIEQNNLPALITTNSFSRKLISALSFGHTEESVSKLQYKIEYCERHGTHDMEMIAMYSIFFGISIEFMLNRKGFPAIRENKT